MPLVWVCTYTRNTLPNKEESTLANIVAKPRLLSCASFAGNSCLRMVACNKSKNGSPSDL